MQDQNTGSARYERKMGPQFQSYQELLERRAADGFTGELSPNVELNMLLREFSRRFELTETGVVSEDTYFYVSKARLGEDKNGKQQHDIVMALEGDPTEFATLLAFALSKDPMMLNLFEAAVGVAKKQRAKRELGGIFDALASVFGHGSAQEWTDDVNRRRADPKPETTTKNPQHDGEKPTA